MVEDKLAMVVSITSFLWRLPSRVLSSKGNLKRGPTSASTPNRERSSTPARRKQNKTHTNSSNSDDRKNRPKLPTGHLPAERRFKELLST
ncbi:unnamed protein product [Laminaria digitata]